jgi:GMP synthase (glutamine-hydrolysing)
MASTERRILILDYSVDRSETALVRKYVSPDDPTTAVFVDREESLSTALLSEGYTHVIHTGSALSIVEPAPFTEMALSLIRGFPATGAAQMGICYGSQLVCLAFCGKESVRRSPRGLEAGWGVVEFTGDGPPIPGTGSQETVWQSHFDEVLALPRGSVVMARGDHTRIQAFLSEDLMLFGTQFHPEFDREDGNRQFLHDRKLLESNRLDVDVVIKGGPSLDTGATFIGFFLDHFHVNRGE